MNVYRPLDRETLLSRLQEPGDTLILFHRNPDADAIGSAFALKELLSALGSRAWCVCGQEIPANLRFLCDAEQESVLPGSIPFDFRSQRIVSVDVASPAQLGDLETLYGDRVDLMIDHHGKGTPFADHFIQPLAAATGEILFDLATDLSAQGLHLFTPTLCQKLYAAISADTGCFRFSNVTPETHRRAAVLLTHGIDSAAINHQLFESRSFRQIKAEGAGIERLGIYRDGKVAAIAFPYELKRSMELSEDELGTLIDVARSVEGVLVAFVVRQPDPEPVFRVSMRSACDFDVSAVCANFGGGGHRRAAGCTFRADTMDKALDLLLSAIDSENGKSYQL